MADIYTSYETSLALRNAGAEQDASQRKPRWCPVNRKHGHVEVRMSNYPQCERAFRADEIIEALGRRLGGMDVYRSNLGDVWTIELIGKTLKSSGPLVEALAQAWLAVLAGAK